MLFSCTVRSFTTTSISLVSLFSHLFCHLHPSYYYKCFIFFLFLISLNFFYGFLDVFHVRNQMAFVQQLEVVGMWWFSSIFFSFHFNFVDSNQVFSFGFSYCLKRARSQVRGLWWCWMCG
ncbi:hypothetical protein AAZV13_13G000100 [Glycine max]